MSEDPSRHSVLRGAALGLPAMVAVILAFEGVGEPGVREVVRWTARTSLLFFSAAFTGGTLAWAARNRDGLLKSLALSHGIRAAAVGTLAILTAGSNLLERASPLNVVGSLGAYTFIVLGAFQPRNRHLSWGLYWVWIVFFVGYFGRALRAPSVFGPAILLLLASLLVRLSEALSRSRTAETT